MMNILVKYLMKCKKKERIGTETYPLKRKESIPFLELDSASCFLNSSISV